MALTRITKGVIKPNENYDTHNIVSTGIVTSVGLDVNGNADVSGSLSVGGVLTYEDVTSIDSVGIITARSGLVSPYADIDDFVSVGSNIHLGNAGVVTATSFVGSGAALTGIDATAIKDTSGNVKIQAQASGAIHSGVSTFQDLDVDGHTNLDNVSVAGVSTFTGNIFATGTFKFSKNGSESFEFDSGGNLLLNTVTPRIQLNDINSENDYQIMNGDGTFVIRDLDRSVSFYSVSSAGQQTFTGNVVLNNDLVGIGNSFQGLYISNGMMITDNKLSGNHYIGTAFNGLMAGPVNIEGTLTIDGNYVVV